MVDWWGRLTRRLRGTGGSGRRRADGPSLAGLDDVARAAVDLQKRYWRPRRLTSPLPMDPSAPADALTLLHQVMLDAIARAGGVDRAIASGAELGDDAVRLAERLAAPDSPFRPRHAFAWRGRVAPDVGADAIPYSTWQGRLANAALSHRGALEVIRLDDALQPARVEFVPFDAIVTVSMSATPGFRPAKLIGEYGAADQLVLIPERYGLTWYSFEPELVRGQATRWVGDASPGVDPPARGWLGVGTQRLSVRSQFADEGTPELGLDEVYQISFAIDADDPRFDDKCAGRGLPPDETRAELDAERRARVRLRTLP